MWFDPSKWPKRDFSVKMSHNGVKMGQNDSVYFDFVFFRYFDFSEFGFLRVLWGYRGGVLGHLGQVKCSFGCFWVENQIWHVLQWFCGALDLVEITISRHPRRKSIFPSLGDTFWGNMLKRSEMGLQVTSMWFDPSKWPKRDFLGQNGVKMGSKWVKMTLFILTLYFSDINFFICAFFDRNMLKRREMGSKVTKNVIWPLKMTKTWFFGQNGLKWG